MDRIEDRAARWGIETEYRDGLGRHRAVEPKVLARLLEIFGVEGGAARADVPPVTAGRNTYQADDGAPSRMWVLVVQLYGVRSRRNWGHGDFTDLRGLIELATALGASGIGLNPLHALFDDHADAFSPYSPSSRQFLNPLYIDPDAIVEFPGLAAAGLTEAVSILRDAELVDYAGLIAAKTRAFTLAYEAFRLRGSSSRVAAFAEFRQRSGALLTRYACFEFLRRRFGTTWWAWPEEWRKPDDEKLTGLRNSEDRAIAYYEFLQWAADEQLTACRERAKELRRPVGLYLDVAVGVRPDGFDAWNDQNIVVREAEIGAPPDRLNLEGQRWGLAGVNPVSLAASGAEFFRRMLRASMRYAGAIRLDHVLGLRRLYMLPAEMRADQGAYLRFPFEQLLAVASEESLAHRCIVIGEDLGTVPDGFRERLADCGLWSYQVMLFERADDGGFIAPDLYRANAAVTFATHDLPTFEGWKSGHDLAVKRALGMDPGETDSERAAAWEAMGRAMAWRGLNALDYPDVIAFLSAAPSRILLVSMEDALGLLEQVNVPGTITEHPNWRRRLPTNLEDLGQEPALHKVADMASAAGRRA